jgi:hypothetical protein
MGFDTLSAAIKAKLQTITELQVVFDYHTSNLTGFPCVTFEPSSNENVFYTNTDNLRSYVFDIIVYQEFNTISRETAIGILRQTVDAVIASFDADYNLSGACDFCMPIPSSFGEVPEAGGNVLFAQMSLVCKAEVTV